MTGIETVNPHLQIAQRCKAILEAHDKFLLVEVHQDSSNGSEQQCEPLPEKKTAPQLSIAQLFIATSGSDFANYDVLILAFLNWKKNEKVNSLVVIMPEVVRNSMSLTRTGLTINDLTLGNCETGCDSIYIGVYKIPRNARVQRVLDGLQDLTSSLNATYDHESKLNLSQLILDRVELFGELPGTELLAHKQLLLEVQDKYTNTSQYYGYIDGMDSALISGKLWLQNRQLMLGDGKMSASAVINAHHILFRLGQRLVSKNVRRYIDELRRKHTLRREELSKTSQSESYLSYLQKEKEQRKQDTLEALYGHHTMLPVVTPIALEVAANLEKVVRLDEEEQTEFGINLQEMREGLSSTFGVNVPGVRLRLNEADMPEGSYLIMINEIPLVMGTVSEEQGYCHEPVEKLETIDVKAEPATDPIDASDGSWVIQADWDKVREGGHKIYNAGEYMVLHLEGVLRKNLRQFNTIDDLDKALSEQQKRNMNSIDYFEGGIARFRDVLSSLLDEDLPVDKLSLLVDEYLKCKDIPAFEIAERLRSIPEINKALTSEAAQWQLFSLTEELENTVTQGIHHCGDAALLALSPEITQDILTAVRNQLGNLDRDVVSTVVVVRNSEIRPYFKKLIELEFPRVWVVAQRELEQVKAELLKLQAQITFE